MAFDPQVIRFDNPKNKLTPAHALVQELANVAAKDLIPRRKFKAALAMNLRAAAVEPRSPQIWANVAKCLWNLQRFDEAKRACDRALELDENEPVALGNMGLIMESLGFYEKAYHYFDKALLCDDNKEIAINTRWNRSLLDLALGNYKRGWRDYETRIDRANQTIYGGAPPIPFWKGEDLHGKGLFVASEQGIGDNIAFSRLIPWLCQQTVPTKPDQKPGRILWCLPPHLVALFWDFRHLPNLEFVPERIPLASLNADYYCFEASIPLRMGLSLENLPADPGYIKSLVDAVPEGARVRLPEPQDPGIKIGVCWTGNMDMDRNEERTVPLELLLELITIPKVWMHSFQVGPAAAQIRELGAEHMIWDLQEDLKLRGLPGCGHAMQQMDLIITSCTSIAHLGGALGIPTWVMLCVDPFWLWQVKRSDSLWYPSVRLFRQKQTKDWRSVALEVRAALIDLLAQKNILTPIKESA